MAMSERMREFLSRQREKAKATVDLAIRKAEVIGSSGAWGYLNHRYGAGEIKLGAAADGSGGVPADAATFFGLTLLGFMGPAKYASHAHAIADGSGAAFAYRAGAEKGDAAAKSTKTSGFDEEPRQLGVGAWSPYEQAWAQGAYAY